MKNDSGETISFPSINSARIHFKVRFTTISNNINKTINIRGENWTITSQN
jgi:hypothetical protein